VFRIEVTGKLLDLCLVRARHFGFQGQMAAVMAKSSMPVPTANSKRRPWPWQDDPAEGATLNQVTQSISLV
jgi:hypothetical protein